MGGDPGTVTLTRDGKAISVPTSDVPSLLASGYGVETSQGQQQREEGELYQERDPGTAAALVMGGLRGATLGGSDVIVRGLGGADQLKDLKDRHPTASFAGEMLGTLSPVGPAAYLNRIGERIVAAGEGAGALGKAAYSIGGGAVVGSGYNAGSYISDVALGDRDLSAEGFVGAMGKGALYGGVASGALSMASNGLIAARKLIPLAEQTPEAARAAELTARQAVGDSVKTSQGLEAAGTNAVSRADQETQQFLQDLEAERAQAIRQAAPEPLFEGGQKPDLSGTQTARGEIREPLGESAPAVESPAGGPTPETAPSAPEQPPAKFQRGDAKQLLKDWRAKYPEGAVDYDAANAAARKGRLAKWAEGFEPKTPEDEAIKAYFQTNQDPIGMPRNLADTPKAVQAVANKAGAEAAHNAYLTTIPKAADISENGTELMARAMYAARRDAARAMDDVYGAYKAGQPIVDIRSAATQKLTGQLHELASARNDLLQSLAKSPEADTLLEQLKATKTAVDESGKLPSLGEQILAGAKPAAQVDPDEAISKALGKSKDVNEDIASIAPKITRYEAAKAQLTESLGPKASQAAQEHAAAFRAAQQKAESSSARQVAQATENIDKAADGAPLEKMVGGAKPALGGLMKTASNAGAAYEALREMGVPLPDPGAIPVVGPILSLYLKAKIVKKMIGKFGGSFAATAENTIAAKASSVRNRIASSVDALAGAGEKIAPMVANAGGPAVALGHKLFEAPDAPKQPYSSEPKVEPIEKMYQARMDELTAAMKPGAIEQAVKARIHTSDPTIVDSIVAAETRRLTYLFAQAPKPDGPPLPGQSPRLPSKTEINSWSVTVAASHDPAAVFERVAAGGTARPAEVDCINTCYPQLVAEARNRLVEKLSSSASQPSYMRRVAVSTLLGIPTDSTMLPDHAAYLQSGFKTPAAAPQPHPTLTSNISLGQQTLTRLDR